MPSRRRPDPSPSPPADRTTASEGDGDDWSPDENTYVEGYDVAPDAIPPMVGVGVPAVVAVVVSRNPGPWLETALASLDRQEYANLTTLVVDAGSLADPTERVAAVLPSAFVKRVRTASYAEAANAALGVVEGASFYLFCHDDVELQPGCVQALVEEAFRSNAGVVGAKLVDWDEPEHLRSVGASIDKFGFLWPVAEPDELDQAQHDAVREVFTVSGAAMLVRCDLFADLGGFSTDIDGWGEELDLCWRARVAGARTVVMPGAVVRHRERAELGDPTGRSAHVALRHQARIMLACYSPVHLLRIAPAAFVLAVVDLLVALVRGRVATARDVVGAIGWNVAHLPSTLRIRGRVKRSRRTPDAEIRRLQIPGSVRVAAFLRRYASGERSVASTLAAAARGLPRGRDGDDGDGLWTAGAVVVTGVLLLVGTRGLIGSGVPAVREFVPSGSASQLWAEWWSGWRSSGLGAASGTPTLALVAAVLDRVTFGSSGLVRTVLLLAPLPLGAVASWRLLRGSASMGARVAALAAYLVNPLPYNCIAEGRWQALVVYGALPSIVGRIARAGAWAPFDVATPAPGSAQRQAVGLGLVVAAASTVAPVVVLVTLVVAVILLVVLSASDRSGQPLRAVGVTAGALGLSALLHLPWTLAVLGGSNRWAVLTGADPSRRTPLSLDRALLFDTGPHGGWLSAGLVFAALVAVLISSGPRLRWAVVSGVLVVSSFAAVVLAGRLAPSVGLPAPELLLSVAAVGVSLGLALGVEAFRTDVVGGAFGLRQLLSLLAVVAVGLSALPLVVDVAGGRWLAPRSDLETAFAPIRPRGVPADRTLWIGDADALTTQGWRFGEGLKFALTDGTSPTFSSLFPAAPGAGERALRDVLDGIGTVGSGRLGERLAPFGVRYVVILRRLAPLPYGQTELPLPEGFQDRLNEQFDLVRVEVAPGLDVFENLAARPVRSTVDDAPGSEATAWTTTGRPPVRFDGELPADRTLLSLTTRDDGWRLEVDDEAIEAEEPSDADSLGWASAYRTVGGGDASLRYSTPATQVALHLVQFLVLAGLPWVRRRRVSEFRVRRTRSQSEPEVST